MNSNDFKPNAGAPSSGTGTPVQDDAVTTPIMAGDEFDAGGGLEGLSGFDEPPRLRLSSGALLLGLVVVIAVGGLFSMRTLTRASAASASPSEIEKTIESFLGVLQRRDENAPIRESFVLGPDQAAVLDVLNESYASRQVAWSEVQRNPFIIFDDLPVAEQPVSQPRQDPRIQMRQDRINLFEQAGKRFELRSVLMGNPPLANLNNRIVRVGDTITVQPEGVNYRVTEITANSVELVAEDRELDVSVKTTVRIRRDRR